MEMQGGSSIRAENLSGGGDGGNITLTVTGSFLENEVRRRDFYQQ